LLLFNFDFIPFNNCGEHDKILDIFTDNFSDITSERSEDDNDSDESSERHWIKRAIKN